MRNYFLLLLLSVSAVLDAVVIVFLVVVVVFQVVDAVILWNQQRVTICNYWYMFSIAFSQPSPALFRAAVCPASAWGGDIFMASGSCWSTSNAGDIWWEAKNISVAVSALYTDANCGRKPSACGRCYLPFSSVVVIEHVKRSFFIPFVLPRDGGHDVSLACSWSAGSLDWDLLTSGFLLYSLCNGRYQVTGLIFTHVSLPFISFL